MASTASSHPPEADRELLRRYHEDGDMAAREQLVERHLPLVWALARRYTGRGESLDDLVQVGSIGLLKAIDRYELSREVALTTYATPNVVGEIKRHFRDKGWAIRIPRGLQELNAKLAKTVDGLTAELGRSPRIAELAEALHTTPEQVLEALESSSAYTLVSLSAATDGEGEADPLEMIGEDDEGFERADERTTLEPALGSLSRRERVIIRMRFEQGLTQTEIADQVGISQMHVSRLIRKSIAQMRERMA